VPPEQIFANVRGIIAQRLVRRLCPKCKVPFELDGDLAGRLNTLRAVDVKPGHVLFRQNRNGCDYCHYRGFIGRIALEEVLELWRRDVTRNVWTGTRLRPDWIDVVRDQARQASMQDMLHNGMLHVRNGITSLEELEKYFSADLEVLQ
jgi:type II secretory ATPase GspE/PulE/Tfp pilus assembly ATPase PilB-like protein